MCVSVVDAVEHTSKLWVTFPNSWVERWQGASFTARVEHWTTTPIVNQSLALEIDFTRLGQLAMFWVVETA